ncbi:phage tail protein [Acinetobacter junii]|uniref:phage tail protein n=1 Tax=Acinetobacter junii TaxID=40215 RepID=UPI0032B58E21
MSDYFNVTTNVGDAAIATAIANNSKLNITHIAFGDGNGSVPTPTKTRTSLVREVHRQAVTKYTMHPTIANYIVIETIIPSNIGGFWIREMGIIADNVLISHGSHAPFFKVADPDGVSEYRLKFTQNVRDGNVVEISLDESLIYASQAWVNENYIRRNELVDNLTTDDAKKPVSAKQAKNLQDNKLDKTANAVSATKLKNARKINTIDFDGSQDINIEAPLRLVGEILTPDQLNSAVLDGKYTVLGLDVAGLYGYGVLVVIRSGGICHQVYYPHLSSPTNNATMAMRQTWNMNGDIASWSEWRVVGTRDDSKLPLAGGTLTGDLMVNGTSNFKSINATGEITIDKPEVVLKHKLSGRYLYINNEDWGVYSPQGSIPLPVGSGGTGNLEGRAPSADRLATPRNIFGQTFDGSGDVGGTITASTGLVQASAYHFIDMGRNSLDRMNFYNFGATFNFIDSQNGNVVARITQNGIDCNAASASKLKTPRNIAISGDVSGSAYFDGSGNIQINTSVNGFDNWKGQNGYTKLPNGLILQWGTQDYASNPGEVSASITFPIAFPNSCLNISLTRKISAQSTDGDGTALLISTTQTMAHISLQHMNQTSTNSLRGYTWLAIGY